MKTRLQLPQRVSRLYPIFSLVLLLTSSVFFYAWQSALISLEDLSHYAEKEVVYQQRIDKLTADQKLDQATLQVQKQKVTDATKQLQDLQVTLASNQKDLTAAQDQLKNQQSQLSQNAAELEKLRSRPPLFSFQNESSLKDIEQKQADVKKLVSDAYVYIQQTYGDPYLLSSIVITFVDEFSIAGSAGEIVIENSSKGIKINIHLKDFNKTDFQDINTVIHEMIHGFHGVAVLESSAMEEGMTVAATDAVMQKMSADEAIPKFDHLYINLTDTQYEDWNENLKIASDNQAFYQNPDVAKVYQLIGSAWFRLYQQDAQFFKKLNAAYYPKVQKGLKPDETLINAAIKSVASTVNGTPVENYLASNIAFNPK